MASGTTGSAKRGVESSAPQSSKKKKKALKQNYNCAETKEDEMKLGAGVTLSMLLKFFRERKLLKADEDWYGAFLPRTGNKSVPSNVGDKEKARLCLELLQYVMTSDEVNTLTSENASSHDVNSIAVDVEERAFLKMWEFEGCDPLRAKANNELQNGNQKKQPMYIPIGRRVYNYKKDILGDKTAKLCERPAEARAAEVVAPKSKAAYKPPPKLGGNTEQLEKKNKRKQSTIARGTGGERRSEWKLGETIEDGKGPIGGG